MHFSQLASLPRYYQSCRHALLAYCAFPNKHPDMGSARSVLALDDQSAADLFSTFIAATQPDRARWGWNVPPPFLVQDFQAARNADARRTDAAKKKAAAKKSRFDFGEATPGAPADAAAAAGGAGDGQDVDEEAPGASTSQPQLQHLRRTWEALSTRSRKSLEQLWKEAEKHEASEVEGLADDDEAVLRRATDGWLREKRWGSRELHDALVSLGSALPRRLSRRVYLHRLRAACSDPKAMKGHGGAFPIKAF